MFPTEGQVAHALLARPPLSHIQHAALFLRGLRVGYDSVRLACVRHAASVRPEPGSNSLKNGIVSPFRMMQSFFERSQLFTLSAFGSVPPDPCVFSTLSRFLAKPKVLTGRFSSLAFLLFNFQGPSPSSLIPSQALISLGFLPPRAPGSQERFAIISNSVPFVKPLNRKNLSFFQIR